MMEKKQESQEELRKNISGCLQAEEEPLNLDELMDVEGGKEPEDPVKTCGLGCYLSGMSGIKDLENEPDAQS